MKGNLFPTLFLKIAVSIVLTVASVPQAEVRTGFWQHIDTSSDSLDTQIDFSELDRNCILGSGRSNCALETSDCFFRMGNLIAPYGVFYDSVLSASLKSFIPSQQLPIGNASLFYLDSMMKRIELSAPADMNYSDSISANFGACFIQTSENHLALLLWAGEYIGGINRVWYYWAYQSDGSRNLVPERLFTLPKQLLIRVDVFSGRPNPYFTITDSETCDLLTRQLYIAVNPYLDSTMSLSEAPDCDNILGYRRILLHGMFEPDFRYSSYLPEIEICGGGVGYREISSTTNWCRDPDNRLLKSMIETGCAMQLTSTNDSDNVTFCDLFPDSLRTGIAIPEKTENTQKECNPVTIRHGSIFCRTRQAGLQVLELHSMNGAFVGELYRGHHPENTIFSLPLESWRYAAGIYFLTLKNGQNPKARYSIPVRFKL